MWHEFNIKEIVRIEEMLAIEEMQRAIWGISDLEVVPASLMIASVNSGGILLAAFGEEDTETPIGFAFAFPGIENGEPVYHSHMLAVDPNYRNKDVGFLLKLEQRNRVKEQGVSAITWTFDPLKSLNAYFNFSKLGVVSNRYLINFYGAEGESFMHQNGTDRLWVEWRFDRVPKLPVKSNYAQFLVIVSSRNRPTLNIPSRLLPETELVIEIPREITEIESENFGVAESWRDVTREAFIFAIDSGFYVDNFVSNQDSGQYFLRRKR